MAATTDLSFAATATWTNTSGGAWNVVSNWSPNQVPGSPDTAVITAPGSYPVSLRGNVSVSALIFGGPSSFPILRIEGANSGASAALRVSNGLTNRATIELTSSNANWNAALNANNGRLVNAPGATVRVLAGAGGDRSLGLALDNQGLLVVEQALTISKNNANHTNSGTITVSGATLDLDLSGSAGSFHNTGTIELVGQTVNVSGGTFTNTVSGTITGTGTFEVTTTSFVNEGTVAPGGLSHGILNVAGNYPQTASGVLAVELGGLTPGTQHDQLAVSGAATLDGTLTATLTGGFQPQQNDSFVVARFASRSGTFSSFNLPLTNRLGWTVVYTSTNATLVVSNTAPSLPVIVDQTIVETVAWVLNAGATDADVPAQTLTYALLAAPMGASINATTGLISWTPTEAQGPSTNTFTVQVSDNSTPSLPDSRSFTVVVTETNTAPVIAAPATQTMDELSPLALTMSATDADVPANVVTFALVSAPAGAAIDPATGVVSWTPTEVQGPGTNTFTVRVSDNGSPSLSATQIFTVVVREVNTAPVLGPLADLTIGEGSTLTITNTATDGDLPANALTFSLDAAPAGAAINPTTGVLTWTPTATQMPSTNLITVRVTDNGAPGLSDARSFTVYAVSVFRITSLNSSDPGSLTITWNTVPGRTYRVQFNDDLNAPTWTDLAGDVLATSVTVSKVDNTVSSAPCRFYRIELLP